MRWLERALVAIGIVCAVSCGSGGRSARPGDGRAAWSRDWRQVVPAGATAVMGVRVAKLAASPLWTSTSMTAAWRDAIGELRQLAQRCAIGGDRIDELVVAAYADHHIAVAIGRFERDDGVACARALVARKGATLRASEVAGTTVYRSTNPRDRAHVAFPAPGIAIVADSRAGIESVLARDRPRIAASGGRLLARASAIGRDADAWGTAELTGGQDLAWLRGLFGTALDDLIQVHARLELADQVKVRLGLVFPSRQRAEEAALFLVTTRDLVDGRGLGRLAGLIAKIDIDAAGAETMLTVSVSDRELGELFSERQGVTRSGQTPIGDGADRSGTVPD